MQQFEYKFFFKLTTVLAKHSCDFTIEDKKIPLQRKYKLNHKLLNCINICANRFYLNGFYFWIFTYNLYEKVTW